jgi:hypothetical protein
VFEFACDSYRIVAFGASLNDAWTVHRALVEETLARLGLSEQLQAIEDGLTSTNVQVQRNAVMGCRGLLSDLASAIWLDPRPTYIHLPGSAKDGTYP